MKRKSVFLAVVAIAFGLLTGCQLDKSSEKLAVQTFTATDSVRGAMTEVIADYPTAGPAVLVDSIRTWIIEMLGGNYNGDLNDGQALVNYFQKSSSDQLVAEYNELRADMEVDEDDPEANGLFDIPSEDHNVLVLDWQNDDFVTYGYAFSIYHTGAAHGIEGNYGTTFFKKDGTRLTWKDVVGSDSPEFQKILREGLMAYIDCETVEELNENLFLSEEYSVDNLPLPRTNPCVRAEGVEFFYSEYEIVAYSYGTPSFIVPFDRIRPLMSERVQRIFETYPESKSKDVIVGRTEMF